MNCRAKTPLLKVAQSVVSRSWESEASGILVRPGFVGVRHKRNEVEELVWPAAAHGEREDMPAMTHLFQSASQPQPPLPLRVRKLTHKLETPVRFSPIASTALSIGIMHR